MAACFYNDFLHRRYLADAIKEQKAKVVAEIHKSVPEYMRVLDYFHTQNMNAEIAWQEYATLNTLTCAYIEVMLP